MNVLRFLRRECIRLPLVTQPQPVEEDETPELAVRRKRREKEAVMEELAEVFGTCEAVTNSRKLLKDLVHREGNATTAILPGIAIPHLRTLQAKELVLGLAVASEPGLHYGSLDGEPTRLFILMAAPPYDDRLYHQVHKQWAEILHDEDTVAQLLECTSAQEVFNALRRWFR